MSMIARKNQSSAFGREDRLLIIFALAENSSAILNSGYIKLPALKDERVLPKIHSLKVSKLTDLEKGAFSIVIQLSKRSVLALKLVFAEETISFNTFIKTFQNALANGSYCIPETEKDILEGNKLLDTRNPTKSHFFRGDQPDL